MTIEQTVEIPADHRLIIDVPYDIPAGKAVLTFTVAEAEPEYGTEPAPDAVESLRGIARKMGSALTVERFLEMRQEDFHLEEEKFRSFFARKG